MSRRRFMVVGADCPEEDREEGAADIEAYDEESAATKYVEHHWADLEYPDEIDVFVRKPGTGEWEKFHVTVETKPDATARRAD